MNSASAAVATSIASSSNSSASPSSSSFLSKYEYVKEMYNGRDCFLLLGKGGCGMVFKAREIGTENYYAVKTNIDPSDVSFARKLFSKEVKGLEQLKARISSDASARACIINFQEGFLEIDASGTVAFVHLVIELSPLAKPQHMPASPGALQPLIGDVDAFLGGPGVMTGCDCDMSDNNIARPPLHIDAAREVMRSLLTALGVLHDKGIIHRDIKPDNLLVWEKGEIPSSTHPATTVTFPRIKITDFGLAKVIEPNVVYTEKKGTVYFRAPEQEGNVYNERVDIFMAGCTLYALMTGEPPALNTSLGYPRRFAAAHLAASFPDASLINDFLAGLTRADPAIRIQSARDALKHPFMKINE